MNCSLFSESRMQSLDRVLLQSESVATCSVLFIVHDKPATFFLVPSYLLSLLDIFPLHLLCVGDAIGRKAKGSDLLGNLVPPKRRCIIIPATWLALLCRGLDGTVGTRVVLRGNGRREGMVVEWRKCFLQQRSRFRLCWNKSTWDLVTQLISLWGDYF